MKTQFEKIYVLSLITNHSRQEFIKHQLNELGIEFEFLYGSTFYNMTNDAKGNKIEFPNVWPWLDSSSARSFGCTLSHYNAVLFAYELGYHNVLIIEDDICFIKDKELIEYYLNNIPENADFVTWDPRIAAEDQYYEFFDKIKYNLHNILNNQLNNNFIKLNNYWDGLCGGMMYGIMNRNIMKLYLDSQNTKFVMSDRVNNIFDTPKDLLINRYMSTHCICLGQYLLENWFNDIYQTGAYCYKTPYEYIDKLDINNFFKPNNFLSWTHVNI